jgi:O-antigen/teichoic acid export membrane protein
VVKLVNAPHWGLDLFVVSRVDFAKVGSYGIAIRLVGLVFGLLTAATAPLMTIASRTAATNDPAAVSRLLLQSTRVTNCANALLGGVLFTAAPMIVRFYAGEKYSQTGSTLLRLLLVGQLIRQMGGSLGIVMVATGEHRKAVVPPMADGLVNLAVSITVGTLIGAAGVAIGTIVGALVSLVLYNLVVFPKLRAFEVHPRSFVAEGVVPAILVFAPSLAAGLLLRDAEPLIVSFATVVQLGIGAAVLARFGLKPDERHAVVNTVRSSLSKLTAR